ncbi:MAG: hypothetical protein M1837_006743 [Sclerophora amabilis]|nr:MAG: hypothetical protein M1837_006743 [Sclerophora amabilis]
MDGFGKGPLDAIIHRKHSSWLQRFFAAPYTTLAKSFYSYRKPASRKRSHTPITVVCVSDTHNTQPSMPDGDLVVHAGDLTQTGTVPELQATIDWLNSLPHKNKVAIAGNHDTGLAADGEGWRRLNWGNVVYLQDSSVNLRFAGGRNLCVYGSPWTPKHGSWAFQYPRGKDIWTGKIPSEADVLITHGPPRFHLDVDGWGDDFLLKEVSRIQPALHVCGHIHGGFGKDQLVFDDFQSRFERICRGEGGLLDVLRMIVGLALTSVRRSVAERTVLVNPSAVGGLQDRDRRSPIVVQI